MKLKIDHKLVVRFALLNLILVSAYMCSPIKKTKPGNFTDLTLTNKVKNFQAYLQNQDYEFAKAMMVPDPRRWWEARAGEGHPWETGPGKKIPGQTGINISTNNQK